MSVFSRIDRSLISKWWWTIDHGILAAVFALMISGMIMVMAASPAVAERIGYSDNHFIIRHAVFLALSIFVFLFFSFLNNKWLLTVSLLIFAVSLSALFLVPIIGSETKGAKRWIAFLGFSVQPSEIVKVSFIIIIGKILAVIREKKKKKNQPVIKFSFSKDYLKNFINEKLTVYGVLCIFLYLMVIGLLLKQPDVGMSALITVALAGQLFISGLPLRYMCFLALLGGGMLLFAYFNFSHVHDRVNSFFVPEAGDTYQIEKSVSAFQSGGVAGTGAGQGVVKFSIPDAHADFIYAVAGEEMGMVFALLILGTYGFVLFRGFGRLNDIDKLFPVIASSGLLIMFGFQAFIHMATNLNLIPPKGMTLPFMSYGGSSMIASAYAMGVILSLTRKHATGKRLNSTAGRLIK